MNVTLSSVSFSFPAGASIAAGTLGYLFSSSCSLLGSRCQGDSFIVDSRMDTGSSTASASASATGLGGVHSPDDIFDNFCCMAVEEFLQRKGLFNTLDTLRGEWQRPDEARINTSWFEVALKLRLPELISQNSRDLSILENLVKALIRESSVRSRQSPEVLLSGLARMPKIGHLPTIVDHHHEHHHIPLARQESLKGPTKKGSSGHKNDNTKNNHYIKRQLESMEKLQTMGNSNRQASKANLSNEAWIPNDMRMKSLGRDIGAANDTLMIIKKREISLAREMKRLLVSDLERARTEEALDATHKTPCGCCLQDFLYVNLPLKVSRKAIFDIRAKWSGKLSSATVFGGAAADNSEGGGDGEGTNANASSSTGSPKKSKQQLALERKNQLLAAVPSCYDQVGVCVFCAQFFQIQEEYRPSYAAITQGERRAAYRETKRREQEYWDPLKMVEKDREKQEAYEAAVAAAAAMSASQATSMTAGGGGGGGIGMGNAATANGNSGGGSGSVTPSAAAALSTPTPAAAAAV